MTTAANLISEMKDHLNNIRAMPNTGSVLFCRETKLAISIPEGTEGHIAGLRFARIFSDAERSHGGKPCLGLDRLYSDGAGRNFYLVEIKVAKRLVIADLEACIRTLETLA